MPATVPPMRLPLGRVLLYSLIWLVFGALVSVQGWAVDVLRRGEEATRLYHWLGFVLPSWAPWVVLTPVALWVTDRIRQSGLGRAGQILLHVAAGFAASFLHAALAVVLFMAIYPTTVGAAPFGRNLAGQLASQGGVSFLVYALVVGAWIALDGWRTAMVRNRQAEVLAHEYSKSRLALLQTQLQPHFLFNTLHAVTVLVTRDPERATRMLVRLGDFLRTTLEGSATAQVTLAEELRMLEDYLELQRTRFRHRLTVTIDIPAECRPVLVPTLVLQPLIENAIRHGIEHRPDGGLVSVTATAANGRLTLEVANDLPEDAGESSPTNASRVGTGLRTTTERLERLYGPDHHFTIGLGPLDRMVAHLTIPTRTVEQ